MSDKSPNIDENAAMDARLKKLDAAERSIKSAYATGKAERSKITRAAQLDAAEAVAMAGIAMEADEEADEAMRISVIAQRSGDRERAKRARKREREARKQANADHKAATKSAKQAYDAIKFSAPNKMGFMRAVQVIFGLHIVVVLLELLLTSRDTVSYDSANIVTWIMIILEGVAFWLFVNRYKVARIFVIAMASFGIVVPLIYNVATGTLGVFDTISSSSFYLSLILYFALSKRVRAVLVNDFSERDKMLDEEFEINRSGWPFVRNLIMYFIVFSVLGHWMEAAMCQLIRLGLVQGEYDPTNTMLWRDWLYPFPMEGSAVVIIALALYPLFQWLRRRFRERPWAAYGLSFLANALTCSIIEFSMGLIINADHQLWDYSDMFGNIMGQVCLQNAAAFGVAASIITWFVYPLMERWIARVPTDIMNIVAIVIFVIGGILWSLYLFDPPQNHTYMEEEVSTMKESVASDEITAYLQLLDVSADALERNIQEAPEDQRELLLQDLTELRELIGRMTHDHGLDALP